jgi:uncharacterized protein YndB with AHSA1/START domain
MTGTLETHHDGRPALRFERRLPYPVERVWRAVSDPAELARWFPATVEWKPEAGERFEAFGQQGEIAEHDPPHHLRWTFGTEEFSFDVRPDGDDACVLVFVHVLDDRALGAQHAAGWTAYFKRLDAHLAGGFLDEMEAHHDAAAVHEAFAGKFGLDPAPGRAQIERILGSAS